MIKEVLYGLIVLLGFPAGFILAKLCKEELQTWKKRLTYIVIIALILIPITYFTNLQYKIPIIITLTFTIITSLTIILRAKNLGK